MCALANAARVALCRAVPCRRAPCSAPCAHTCRAPQIGSSQGKGIFLFERLNQISEWKNDYRWKPEDSKVSGGVRAWGLERGVRCGCGCGGRAEWRVRADWDRCCFVWLRWESSAVLK